MPDTHIVELPKAPKKSPRDILVMRMEVEAIHGCIAQVPTRSDLARAALGIIFCTALVTSLFGWWLMSH